MKQQDFETRNNPDWVILEHWLSQADSKTSSTTNDSTITAERVVPMYRQLCHHCALARSRGYSPELVDRLNRLALELHHVLYQHNQRLLPQILYFLFLGFPEALRTNARLIGLSAAFFLLPGLAMFIGCLVNNELIYTLMSPEDVWHFEAIYDPANAVLGRERASDTDLQMFGFYIKNNIGISFQVFAGGLLFGLGSVFYLVYNGLAIGGVAGHIVHLGFDETFFPFVVGHGAFELTAIVFSGAAGLRLGLALIDPGPYHRLTALRLAAKEAVKLIYGTTLMLLLAAFLEAFWSSSSTMASPVKYTVGAAFWFMVLVYSLSAAWRRRGSRSA
ncbi:stage II sporulation protein M [Kistimonas scapharcae]|uniref:Stage II sporulation protein M n=1 Tax=Kistimonas scapharcae TaxID=1036133 RepID=A0ABP8V6E4_9GAMM